MNIDAGLVRSLLSYDRESGELRWLKTNGRARAGNVAGCIEKEFGYLVVGVRGKRYLSHRLIWLMETGEWPTGVIDHINGAPSDNRWVNLRDVGLKENAHNLQRARRDNNSSGVLGVSWLKDRKKWRASIRVNGRQIGLGKFNTIEAAHAAYLKAKAVYHPTANIVH